MLIEKLVYILLSKSNKINSFDKSYGQSKFFQDQGDRIINQAQLLLKNKEEEDKAIGEGISLQNY